MINPFRPRNASHERMIIARLGLIIWLVVALAAYLLGWPYVAATVAAVALIWYVLPDPS